MEKTAHTPYRKAIAAIFLIASVLALAASVRFAFVVPVIEKVFVTAKRPLIIAHRGGMGLWPENTLYAFERALKAGADVVELDLRPTADGEIVVIHDETVDRTSNGKGRVAELTLEELKNLDFAYNFIPDGQENPLLRGEGVTIPTLGELFRRLPDAYFTMEIKPDSPDFARKVAEFVRQTGMAQRVVLSSFHTRIVEYLQKHPVRIDTAASKSETTAVYILSKIGLGRLHQPKAKVYQVPVIHEGLRVVTPAFVRAAHSAGQEVYVWTIDEPSEMKRLLEMNVDGIITNRPDLLLRVVKDGG